MINTYIYIRTYVYIYVNIYKLAKTAYVQIYLFFSIILSNTYFIYH